LKLESDELDDDQERSVVLSVSGKQDLIQYLQFLKSSGFLYLENKSGDLQDLDAALIRSSGGHPQERAQPAGGDRAVVSEQEQYSKGRPGYVHRSGPSLHHAQRDTVESNHAAQADLFGAIKPMTEPVSPAEPAFEGQPLSVEERREKLQELAEKAEVCRACPLGSSRKQAVFSDGDPDARLMFVGEAPGEQEDEKGVPFVGRAGQLLTKMVQAIGFERHEVYICNTLKCRPPNNRDPKPEEKNACEQFLAAQLEILRPSIIIALGAHAAQYLCRSELTIGKLRSKWHTYHGVPLLATYHPAFLLRSPGMKSRSWDDFIMIHTLYTQMNPDEPREIWRKEG
jgi:uracil-DNA glycosylase family 4